MANPVVHFEIGCKDRDKTNAFFTELFDWNTKDYGPFSKSISTGTDTGIQGYMTALGHEPHNYVMVYVEVEEIAPYLDQVVELGGKVMVPETAVPNMGSFAWINDLDGNIIGLWKGEAENPR